MIRRKYTVFMIVFALSIVASALFCFGGASSARAAALPKYDHTFQYNCSIDTDGKLSASSGTTSRLSVGSASYFDTFSFGLQIYGSTFSGSATSSIGQYFGFDTVHIVADVDTSYQWTGNYSLLRSVRLTDAGGGTVVSRSVSGEGDTLSQTLYSGSLSEGTYYLTVEWTTRSKPNTFANEIIETTIMTSFGIDMTAPTGTLYGGDTRLSNGATTSEAVSFEAVDALSGLDALYVKKPGASTYSVYRAGTKLTAKGRYSFYCTDRAGNESGIYTVTIEDAHAHQYTAKVTPPTCTTGGYTEYTCTECGYSYIGDKTEALGHDYRSTTSGVSCTTGGIIRFTCSRCGDSYTEDITPMGHSYQSKTVSPTCTSGGYTRHTCTRCGDTYTTNQTSALGHSYTVYDEREPTCTSGTVTVYRCTRCGTTYSDEDADPLGHSYDANVINPTCTAGGYTIFSCRRCNYSYSGNSTAALGHSYKAATTPSSCTQEGYTTYKCTRCGASYSDSPTQATGHSYVAEIKESTCLERGYTVYTCSKCGDSYRTNETAPLGHNYAESVKGATCTEAGSTVYTCTRCGESYEGGTTAPLGHNYVAEQKPASCMEEGGTVYTCTRCGASYNGDPIPPLGHSYVSKAVAATCEEGGYVLHTCSRCGESYEDNRTQPLGHNFVTTEEPPSCTEGSRTVYTCQVCGFEKTEETGDYPTGHDYTSVLLHSATCTEPGERKFVCDVCGEEYTEVIPATGHCYEITDTASNGGVTIRTYTCTVCGDSYSQELGDQYEEVVTYIEYLFETYRPYMVWVFLATAGIWSIVMGVFFAIAQKNDEKEKARKMLINYFIGLVVIFVIVVACPYLVRGIAALIT